MSFGFICCTYIRPTFPTPSAMAGHVVRLAPVTVLMLLGTMGAGAGVGSCGDAKCSADCGPVSHMFDDDADDSTERSQADAGGCGWDSSTASCRKGFFTVASEVSTGRRRNNSLPLPVCTY